MNLWKTLKGKVRYKEPLKDYTTFRIGGKARFLIEPQDTQDLKVLLGILKRCNIPFLLIGAGSNILVSDKGVDAAVLRLNSPYFRRLSFKGDSLEAASGVMLSRLVFEAQKLGLSGLEFLCGIPGTIGGALAMNAGISEVHSSCLAGRRAQLTVHSVGDLVEDVKVMDHNGNIKTLTKKQIKFGYRKSSLAKYIILGVHFKLIRKNKEAIKDKIKNYLKHRRDTQDLNWRSAGCVFKNPAGKLSAGKMIDLCGLKGKHVGDAYVSWKHANFILNTANARARDVIKLMDTIKEKVNERFNVILEPEIKIWK